jgi:hypothetical protein
MFQQTRRRRWRSREKIEEVEEDEGVVFEFSQAP